VLFRKARGRCGIEDLHFHDSRATAITRLAKKLDILDLARMIGHANLGQLRVYYRETAEDIAAKL
jgi:integrase